MMTTTISTRFTPRRMPPAPGEAPLLYSDGVTETTNPVGEEAGTAGGALTTDAAWRALVDRDRESDGRFVFGVVTTGIYCRPSCSARRPLRKNVRFFSGPRAADAAEAAGFRACRRCRPREVRNDPARRMAESARDYLEAHLDETVTLARLADEVGASPWHLQRTFKGVFGQTPKAYVNARRLERVRTALREEADVTTALYEAGFTSSSQLYAQAGAKLGMTPRAWRRGGRGVRVRFATAPSPLGRVLVGATDRGVCSVLLGDDDRELAATLRKELPAATVERGGPDLDAWVAEVVRRVSGEAAARELPLDTPATAFQRRVWQALTEIPRGETLSYGEVASRLGRPEAARAVARACASNRLAVVVPCHRVVKAGGEAGGYRWGDERKRRLLAAEGAAAIAAAAAGGARGRRGG